MRLRTVIVGLVLLAFAGAGLFYALTIPSPAVTGPLPPRTADLANGETMFNIGGCTSCHATPQQKDERRLGGGLALATPFGTFKVPNISPDATHGIGGWSEAAFVNAMLRGIGRDGEHLYPAFPYTSYQRMALNDVRDLYAFLRTLPPEARPSEPHQLPFPFNVRRGLGLWKLLYLDGRPFAPDPARSAELNRGAYLVEGPGHCAECHSPRDILGGIVTGRHFSGGPAAGWQGLGAEHHAPHRRHRQLVGQGHRLPAAVGPHAGRGLRGLDHGGGGAQYRQAFRRRPRRHRRLSQVVAGGAGAERQVRRQSGVGLRQSQARARVDRTRKPPN